MIHYYLSQNCDQNERDLASFGINVESSTGLIGRPDFKPSEVFSWDYLDGERINLKKRRYKSREIVLKCWMRADDKQAVVEKMNEFLSFMNADGLIKLRVDIGGESQRNKPLFYLVYQGGISNIEHKWRKGKNIVKFNITLVEPSPLKRIYEVNVTDEGIITANYSCQSEIDIYWGDGEVSYDIVGENKSVEHTYQKRELLYVIVVGAIGDIEQFMLSGRECVVKLIYDEI